jgi:hypothetical protein
MDAAGTCRREKPHEPRHQQPTPQLAPPLDGDGPVHRPPTRTLDHNAGRPPCRLARKTRRQLLTDTTPRPRPKLHSAGSFPGAQCPRHRPIGRFPFLSRSSHLTPLTPISSVLAGHGAMVPVYGYKQAPHPCRQGRRWDPAGTRMGASTPRPLARAKGLQPSGCPGPGAIGRLEKDQGLQGASGH